MVFAFLIQSVHPSFCQVLHSQVFKNQTRISLKPDSKHGEGDKAEEEVRMSREERKESLQRVAERVCVEYDFLRSQNLGLNENAETRGNEEGELEALARGGSTLPELETGMFLLNPKTEPYFSSAKCVLWCAALNTAFVLVMETLENRVLANIILKHLVKYLQDYAQVLTNPKEILLKPDVIVDVVRCVMPAGQLRFINHKIIKQIERELSESGASGAKRTK